MKPFSKNNPWVKAFWSCGYVLIILYVYTGITLLSVELTEPGVSITSGIVEQVEAGVLTGLDAVEHEEEGAGFAESGESMNSGTVEHEGEKTASNVIKTRGSREKSFLNPGGEGIFIFQVKSFSFTFITALRVSIRGIGHV
jgi:hypothetical protein